MAIMLKLRVKPARNAAVNVLLVQDQLEIIVIHVLQIITLRILFALYIARKTDIKIRSISNV